MHKPLATLRKQSGSLQMRVIFWRKGWRGCHNGEWTCEPSWSECHWARSWLEKLYVYICLKITQYNLSISTLFDSFELLQLFSRISYLIQNRQSFVGILSNFFPYCFWYTYLYFKGCDRTLTLLRSNKNLRASYYTKAMVDVIFHEGMFYLRSRRKLGLFEWCSL